MDELVNTDQIVSVTVDAIGPDRSEMALKIYAEAWGGPRLYEPLILPKPGAGKLASATAILSAFEDAANRGPGSNATRMLS